MLTVWLWYLVRLGVLFVGVQHTPASNGDIIRGLFLRLQHRPGERRGMYTDETV